MLLVLVFWSFELSTILVDVLSLLCILNGGDNVEGQINFPCNLLIGDKLQSKSDRGKSLNDSKSPLLLFGVSIS